MPDNVYKVIELVGTSEESWEKAAKAAVERAAQSLRDLRVAEVVEQDLVIEKGKVPRRISRLLSSKRPQRHGRRPRAYNGPLSEGVARRVSHRASEVADRLRSFCDAVEIAHDDEATG